MKQKLLSIVAVIGAVFSALFLLFRNKPSKVLAENEAAKEKLKEIDVQLKGSRDALKLEEEMRNQLKEDLEKAKNEEVNDVDLATFFNTRK